MQAREYIPLFFVPVLRNHDHDRFSDCFRSGIAVKALRPPVPARDLPVEILADNGVIRGIDNGPEQKPRLFGFPALGDVARNGKLDDGAVGAAQRHGLGFHAAALAFQSDDVEFKRALFATANALIEVPEALAVLRRDEIVNASADHVIGRRGADHLQPRFIHQQQRAVGGDQLDALGRRLDNRPEALLALAQCFSARLRLGNVDQHVDRAGQAALVRQTAASETA